MREGAPPTNGPDPLTRIESPPHTPPQPRPTAAPPGVARTTSSAWHPGQQAAPEPGEGESVKEQYPSQCSGGQKENSLPGSWSHDKYPSRVGTQNEDKYPSRARTRNEDKYPSQGESQGGRIREPESSESDSQSTNQGNKMASGEKAKGKEKIKKNGWQVVVAKRRKRLPATPATHVESPIQGMQTGTTRPTTPTDRGPP